MSLSDREVFSNFIYLTGAEIGRLWTKPRMKPYFYGHTSKIQSLVVSFYVDDKIFKFLFFVRMDDSIIQTVNIWL